MNRNNRYFAAKKELKAKANKFASLEIANSMLGEGYGSCEMRAIEMWVLKQKPKKVEKFWMIVNKEVEAYHAPVVEGNDGQMYSAYDMDAMMMNY